MLFLWHASCQGTHDSKCLTLAEDDHVYEPDQIGPVQAVQVILHRIYNCASVLMTRPMLREVIQQETDMLSC